MQRAVSRNVYRKRRAMTRHKFGDGSALVATCRSSRYDGITKRGDGGISWGAIHISRFCKNILTAAIVNSPDRGNKWGNDRILLKNGYNEVQLTV